MLDGLCGYLTFIVFSLKRHNSIVKVGPPVLRGILTPRCRGCGYSARTDGRTSARGFPLLVAIPQGSAVAGRRRRRRRRFS